MKAAAKPVLSMTQRTKKSVSFDERRLETIYLVESNRTTDDLKSNDGTKAPSQVSGIISSSSVCRTEEMTILSTEHGRARRYLRDIAKKDLQAALKYGICTNAMPDRKTGQPRYKFTYANTVYITDHTQRQEITSYKESVSIQPAIIDQQSRERHEQMQNIIDVEPHLITSHTFVVLDQSGSMKTADVNGFRNRSQAAYGCLALDFVANQLYDQGDQPGADAFSLIEMNDEGTEVFSREPFDSILFNNLLERQRNAKPRSHGNYLNSLQIAYERINDELKLLDETEMEQDDYPPIYLILLSDGKPSDNDEADVSGRLKIVELLAKRLGRLVTFLCMGLGPSGADFVALQDLAAQAQQFGSKSEFTHAGLSAANLAKGFSSFSSTMTSVRQSMMTVEEDENKEEDGRRVIKLKDRKSLARSRQDCNQFINRVRRFSFSFQKWKTYQDPWIAERFMNTNSIGFEMDKLPFGKGVERLAFRFQEINQRKELLGNVMVAKESKQINSEFDREKFHMTSMRTQLTALNLANKFSRVLETTPALQPIHSYECVPKIKFVQCFVYQYVSSSDRKESYVLVEQMLPGKWEKFMGNNGFVSEDKQSRANQLTVDLNDGTATATDVLHAFSHWTYFHTNQKLLVCDLQGVLYEEGKFPAFRLTDPAIHSRNKGAFKFGKTDCGMKGIRNFSRTHKCNAICRGLGLPAFGQRNSRNTRIGRSF